MDKAIVALSFCVLTFGIFFGIGETLALEFTFFNSSTYVDFLTKSAKAIPLWGITVFVGTFLIKYLGKPIKRVWTKLRESKNKEPQKEPKTLYKMLRDNFKHMATTATGIVFSFLITAIWGFATIVLQNEKTVDAEVFLENKKVGLKGNLLATNSSTIAFYSNDKLHMIPLENVERIQYEKSYYVRIRRMLKV